MLIRSFLLKRSPGTTILIAFYHSFFSNIPPIDSYCRLQQSHRWSPSYLSHCRYPPWRRDPPWGLSLWPFMMASLQLRSSPPFIFMSEPADHHIQLPAGHGKQPASLQWSIVLEIPVCIVCVSQSLCGSRTLETRVSLTDMHNINNPALQAERLVLLSDKSNLVYQGYTGLRSSTVRYQ